MLWQKANSVRTSPGASIMAALALHTPYNFGEPAAPEAAEGRPPSRSRTPQRREVALRTSKRKERRRAQEEFLREALRRVLVDDGGEEGDDRGAAEARTSVVADCIADREALETYLSCQAASRPERRRRRGDGAGAGAGAATSARTEALRGWFRVERASRGALRDDQAAAVERRLVDWLGDDRPLSPQRLFAPTGLRLRAPYGGGPRGRLVVHAVARFHGASSRTLEGEVVLIERPRAAGHRLAHGARIADALAHFRGAA